MRKILCFLLVIICCLCAACGRTTSSLAVDIIEPDGTLEEPIYVDSNNQNNNHNNNDSNNNQNNDVPSKTVGAVLSDEFQNYMLLDGTIVINDIMETIRVNPEIPFMTEICTIKEGNLQGFGGNITGFKEGAMLYPTIPTIPFVAYVFLLDDSQDAENFARNLTANVDLKLNEVEDAEEIVVSVAGQYVFCVISMYYFEV